MEEAAAPGKRKREAGDGAEPGGADPVAEETQHGVLQAFLGAFKGSGMSAPIPQAILPVCCSLLHHLSHLLVAAAAASQAGEASAAGDLTVPSSELLRWAEYLSTAAVFRHDPASAGDAFPRVTGTAAWLVPLPLAEALSNFAIGALEAALAVKLQLDDVQRAVGIIERLIDIRRSPGSTMAPPAGSPWRSSAIPSGMEDNGPLALPADLVAQLHAATETLNGGQRPPQRGATNSTGPKQVPSYFIDSENAAGARLIRWAAAVCRQETWQALLAEDRGAGGGGGGDADDLRRAAHLDEDEVSSEDDDRMNDMLSLNSDNDSHDDDDGGYDRGDHPDDNSETDDEIPPGDAVAEEAHARVTAATSVLAEGPVLSLQALWRCIARIVRTLRTRNESARQASQPRRGSSPGGGAGGSGDVDQPPFPRSANAAAYCWRACTDLLDALLDLHEATPLHTIPPALTPSDRATAMAVALPVLSRRSAGDQEWTLSSDTLESVRWLALAHDPRLPSVVQPLQTSLTCHCAARILAALPGGTSATSALALDLELQGSAAAAAKPPAVDPQPLLPEHLVCVATKVLLDTVRAAQRQEQTETATVPAAGSGRASAAAGLQFQSALQRLAMFTGEGGGATGALLEKLVLALVAVCAREGCRFTIESANALISNSSSAAHRRPTSSNTSSVLLGVLLQAMTTMASAASTSGDAPASGAAATTSATGTKKQRMTRASSAPSLSTLLTPGWSQAYMQALLLGWRLLDPWQAAAQWAAVAAQEAEYGGGSAGTRAGGRRDRFGAACSQHQRSFVNLLNTMLSMSAKSALRHALEDAALTSAPRSAPLRGPAVYVLRRCVSQCERGKEEAGGGSKRSGGGGAAADGSDGKRLALRTWERFLSGCEEWAASSARSCDAYSLLELQLLAYQTTQMEHDDSVALMTRMARCVCTLLGCASENGEEVECAHRRAAQVLALLSFAVHQAYVQITSSPYSHTLLTAAFLRTTALPPTSYSDHTGLLAEHYMAGAVGKLQTRSSSSGAYGYKVHLADFSNLFTLSDGSGTPAWTSWAANNTAVVAMKTSVLEPAREGITLALNVAVTTGGLIGAQLFLWGWRLSAMLGPSNAAMEALLSSDAAPCSSGPAAVTLLSALHGLLLEVPERGRGALPLEAGARAQDGGDLSVFNRALVTVQKAVVAGLELGLPAAPAPALASATDAQPKGDARPLSLALVQGLSVYVRAAAAAAAAGAGAQPAEGLAKELALAIQSVCCVLQACHGYYGQLMTRAVGRSWLRARTNDRNSAVSAAAGLLGLQGTSHADTAAPATDMAAVMEPVALVAEVASCGSQLMPLSVTQEMDMGFAPRDLRNLMSDVGVALRSSDSAQSAGRSTVQAQEALLRQQLCEACVTQPARARSDPAHEEPDSVRHLTATKHRSIATGYKWEHMLANQVAAALFGEGGSAALPIYGPCAETAKLCKAARDAVDAALVAAAALLRCAKLVQGGASSELRSAVIAGASLMFDVASAGWWDGQGHRWRSLLTNLCGGSARKSDEGLAIWRLHRAALLVAKGTGADAALDAAGAVAAAAETAAAAAAEAPEKAPHGKDALQQLRTASRRVAVSTGLSTLLLELQLRTTDGAAMAAAYYGARPLAEVVHELVMGTSGGSGGSAIGGAEPAADPRRGSGDLMRLLADTDDVALQENALMALRLLLRAQPEAAGTVAAAMALWPPVQLDAVIASVYGLGTPVMTEDLTAVLACLVGVGGGGNAAAPSALMECLLAAFLNRVMLWVSWQPAAAGVGQGAGAAEAAEARPAHSVQDVVVHLANRLQCLPELLSFLTALARPVAMHLPASRAIFYGIVAAKLRLARALLMAAPCNAVRDVDERWVKEESTSALACLARNAGGSAAATAAGLGGDGGSSAQHAAAALPLSCTFMDTDGDYIQQHWYNCHTCGLVNEKGCCKLCTRVCHKGHELSYSRYSPFSCDCGGKDHNASSEPDSPCSPVRTQNFKCRCMRQHSQAEVNAIFGVPAGISALSTGSASASASASSHAVARALPLRQPVLWTPEQWDRVASGGTEFADLLQVHRSFRELALEQVSSAAAGAAGGAGGGVREWGDGARGWGALFRPVGDAPAQVLHEVKVDRVVQPLRMLKPTSFMVSLPADGSSRGKVTRSVMAAHGINRSALDADSRGRLALPENQSVLLVDSLGLLAPRALDAGLAAMDRPADRSHMCTLAKVTVAFDIIGVRFCPANDNHLLVWGLTRCCVVAFSASPKGPLRAQKLPLDLSFGLGEKSNSVLLRAEWLPGSQTAVAVTCTQFVRVFDLAGSISAPVQMLFLPGAPQADGAAARSSSIHDAVLVTTPRVDVAAASDTSGSAPPPGLATSVIVLTDGGELFSEALAPCAPADASIRDAALAAPTVETKLTHRLRTPQPPPRSSEAPGAQRGCLYLCLSSQLLIYSPVGAPPLMLRLDCGRDGSGGEGGELRVAGALQLLPCTNGDGSSGGGGDGGGGGGGGGGEASAMSLLQVTPPYTGWLECDSMAGATGALLCVAQGQKGRGDRLLAMRMCTRSGSAAAAAAAEFNSGDDDDKSSARDEAACSGGGAAGGGGGGASADSSVPSLSVHLAQWQRLALTAQAAAASPSAMLSVSRQAIGGLMSTSPGPIQGLCMCPLFAAEGAVEVEAQYAAVVLLESGCVQCYTPVKGTTAATAATAAAAPAAAAPADGLGGNKDTDAGVEGKARRSPRGITAPPPRRPAAPALSSGVFSARSEEGGGVAAQQQRDAGGDDDIVHRFLMRSLTAEQRSAQGAHAQDASGALKQPAPGASSWHVPLYLFETLTDVSSDPTLSFCGDGTGSFTSEQMQSKLRRGGEEYFMSPRMEGGAIAIVLGRKDLAIVAVRIQVGIASSEHIPRELRVLGRARRLLEATARCYDFIFTAEEVRAARKVGAVVVSMSTSHEPGNHPLVDSIEVYARPAAQALAKGALDPDEHRNGSSSSGSSGLLGAGDKATAAADDARREQAHVRQALSTCSEALTLLPRPSAAADAGGEGVGGLCAGALAVLRATCLAEDVQQRWAEVRQAQRLLLSVLEPAEAAAKVDATHLAAVHQALQQPGLPLHALRRCTRLCCHAVQRLADSPAGYGFSGGDAGVVGSEGPGTRVHAVFPQLLAAMWRILSQQDADATEVDGAVGDLIRLAVLDMVAQQRGGGGGAAGGAAAAAAADGGSGLRIALERLLPLLCAPSLRISSAATRHLADVLGGTSGGVRPAPAQAPPTAASAADAAAALVHEAVAAAEAAAAAVAAAFADAEGALASGAVPMDVEDGAGADAAHAQPPEDDMDDPDSEQAQLAAALAMSLVPDTAPPAAAGEEPDADTAVPLKKEEFCCDGCKEFPVRIVRYHCTVCADFDLCQACYSDYHVARGDDLSLIPNSEHTPQHRVIAIPIVSHADGGGSAVLSAAELAAAAAAVPVAAMDVDTPPPPLSAAPPGAAAAVTEGGGGQAAAAAEAVPGALGADSALHGVLAELGDALFPLLMEQLPRLAQARAAAPLQFAHYMVMLLRMAAADADAAPKRMGRLAALVAHEVRAALHNDGDDGGAGGSGGGSGDGFAAATWSDGEMDALSLLAQTLRHLLAWRPVDSASAAVPPAHDDAASAAELADEAAAVTAAAAPRSLTRSSAPAALWLSKLLAAVCGMRSSRSRRDKGRSGGSSAMAVDTAAAAVEPPLEEVLCRMLGLLLSEEEGVGRRQRSGVAAAAVAEQLPQLLRASVDTGGDSAGASAPAGVTAGTMALLLAKDGCTIASDAKAKTDKTDTESLSGSKPPTPIGTLAACARATKSAAHGSRAEPALNVLLASLLELCADMASALQRRTPASKSTETAGDTSSSGGGGGGGGGDGAVISSSAHATRSSSGGGGGGSSSRDGALLSWSRLWPALLCHVIAARAHRGVKPVAKRLLRRLCHGQSRYHAVRDGHLFSAEMRKVVSALPRHVHELIRATVSPAATLNAAGPQASEHSKRWARAPVELEYTTQVGLRTSLRTLEKAARVRAANWRAFAALPSLPQPELPWMAGASGESSTSAIVLASGTSCAHPLEQLPPVCVLFALAEVLTPDLRYTALSLLEIACNAHAAPAAIPPPSTAVAAASASDAPSTALVLTTALADGSGAGGSGGGRDGSSSGSSRVAEATRLLLAQGMVPPSVLVRLCELVTLMGEEKEARDTTAALVRHVWAASPSTAQAQVVRRLTAALPAAVIQGVRARQWLDLLVSLVSELARSGDASAGLDAEALTLALAGALRGQLAALRAQPNAQLYEAITAVTTAPPCALELEPCLACAAAAAAAKGGGGGGGIGGEHGSAPPLPQHLAMVPLDTMRATFRTSENAMLVQLKGRYMIRKLALRVHEPHGRFVKLINVYYSPKKVSTLAELRMPENADKWHFCVAIPMEQDKLSVQVELPLPLLAANLMFEYAEFHEGGDLDVVGARDRGAAAAGLLCPRCGRPVTDMHGICRQCGEVAFQCRQCRHINYERLDAFLCVECGYCAYGQFSFRVAATRAGVGCDVIATEAECKDAIKAVEACAARMEQARKQLHELRPRVQALVELIQHRDEQGSDAQAQSMNSLITHMLEAELSAGMRPSAVKFLRGETAVSLPPMDELLGDADDHDEDKDDYDDNDEGCDDDDEDGDGDGDGGWGGLCYAMDNDDNEENKARTLEALDVLLATMRDNQGDMDGNACPPAEIAAVERAIVQLSGSPAGRAAGAGDDGAKAASPPAAVRMPLSAVVRLARAASMGSISEARAIAARIASGDGGDGGGEGRVAVGLDGSSGGGGGGNEGRVAVGLDGRPMEGRGVVGLAPRSSSRGAHPWLSGASSPPQEGDAPRAARASGAPGRSAAARTLREIARSRDRAGSGDGAAAANAALLALPMPPSPGGTASQAVIADVSPHVSKLVAVYGGECRAAHAKLQAAAVEMEGLQSQLRRYQRAQLQGYRRSHYLAQPPPNHPTVHGGRCYRCAQEIVSLLLELLQTLTLTPQLAARLLESGLVMELVDGGVRVGGLAMRAAARAAVVALAERSSAVTAFVNSRLRWRLQYTVTPGAGTAAARGALEDLLLLHELCLSPTVRFKLFREPQAASSELQEEHNATACWRQHMRLLQDVLSEAATLLRDSPAVAQHVALPCLQTLAAACLKADLTPTLEAPAAGGNALADTVASAVLRDALNASADAWGDGQCPHWQTVEQARRKKLAMHAWRKWTARALRKSSAAAAPTPPSAVAETSQPLTFTSLQALPPAAPVPAHFLWQLLVAPQCESLRVTAALLLHRLASGVGSGDAGAGGGVAASLAVMEATAHVVGCAVSQGLEAEAVQAVALMAQLWGGREGRRTYALVRNASSFLCKLLLREAEWLQRQEVEQTWGPVRGGAPPRSGLLLVRLVHLLSGLASGSTHVAKQLQAQDLPLVLEVSVKLKGLTIACTRHTDEAAALLDDLLSTYCYNTTSAGTAASGPAHSARSKVLYLSAMVSVLRRNALYHAGHHHHHPLQAQPLPQAQQQQQVVAWALPLSAVRSVLREACDAVVPPKRLPRFAVLLRRAPTQEEFFRGSLPTNPIFSWDITSADAGRSGGAPGEVPEPTLRDLRARIAKDLDMADAMELLELLVCGRIVSLDIPIRVVQAELWRPHVLSINANDYDSDCDAEVLPPMTVTYRLAGVDGEATEEVVETLVDSAAQASQDPEQQFACTSAIGENGGLPLLLALAHPPQLPHQHLSTEEGSEGGSTIAATVGAMRAEVCTLALRLLRHCCMLHSNRARLVAIKAPGVLLRRLVEVLRGSGSGTSAGSSESNGAVADSLLQILELLVQQHTDSGVAASSPSTADDLVPMETDSEPPAAASTTAAAAAEATDAMDTEGQDESEDSDGAAEGDEDESGAQHLDFLLTALLEDGEGALVMALLSKPALAVSVSRTMPFLTYGRTAAARMLAERLVQVVDWEAVAEEESAIRAAENAQPPRAPSAQEVRRQCFLGALDVMGADSGRLVRHSLLQAGFVTSTAAFVMQGVPDDKSGRGDEWTAYYKRPALERAIKTLSGLCKGHTPSQQVLLEQGVLAALHTAASNASSGSVGLIAEALLDEIASNTECSSGPPAAPAEAVKAMRVASKAAKREMAQLQRAKALQAMGQRSQPAAAKVPAALASPARRASAAAAAAAAASPSSRGAAAMAAAKAAAAAASAAAAAAASASWMDEMNALEEESGLACMVCQEGYVLRPAEPLGVYVYARCLQNQRLSDLEGDFLVKESSAAVARAAADAAAAEVARQLQEDECDDDDEEEDDSAPMSPYQVVALRQLSADAREYRSEQQQRAGFMTRRRYPSLGGQARVGGLIATVTALNAIHLSCHREAVRSDRGLRNPKTEWEGAALRNSRVLCNSILPIKPPTPASAAAPPARNAEDSWSKGVDLHFSHLREVGKSESSRLALVLHDIRLLLLQLSYQETMRSASGGGSVSSNMTLLWHQLQLAAHLAGATTSPSNASPDPSQANHYKSLLAAFIESAKVAREEAAAGAHESPEAAANAKAPYAMLHECVCFAMVLTMVFSTPTAWLSNRSLFLEQALRHAGARRARGIESSGVQDKAGVSGAAASSGGSGTLQRRRSRSRSMSGALAAGAGGGKRKRSGSVADGDTAESDQPTPLSSARPLLLFFGLVDRAHHMAATSHTASSATETTGETAAVSPAQWATSRDNEGVIALGSELLRHYEQSLVPAMTPGAHIAAAAPPAADALSGVSDLYLVANTSDEVATRDAVDCVEETYLRLVLEGEAMAAPAGGADKTGAATASR